MIKTSTSGSLKNAFVYSCFLLILTLSYSIAYAQTKNYATVVSKQSHVDNATNALSSNPLTYATLNSYGGIAVNILSFSGELELKFSGDIPAGRTTFVRIDFNPDILNELLKGNLGGLLGDVVGNVLLGDHSFEIGARNANGTTVALGASTGAFTSPKIKLVKDANNFYYVAITPAEKYNRVYIKDVTSALAVGNTNSMKVFYAFNSEVTDPCGIPFLTGYEGTGISLGVLNLGKTGVTNPEFAIDNISNNYSEMSIGLLAVLGTISQNFYFETLSEVSDDFKIRIKVPPALINAGVLNNIRVTAYNGTDSVFTQSVSSLLDLDLLGLLSSDQIVSIPFSPGKQFNRVKITLASVVDVNQTVQVYGVTRSAGRPTLSAAMANGITICNTTTASLTATTSSANELIWYDAVQGGTALSTVTYNGTYTTPNLTSTKTYYVAARNKNCPEESGRVPVKVTVLPAIVFATTTLSNATIGFSYNKQINAATGGTPAITYAITGGNLPNGLSFSNTGVISGTPTISGDYNFSVTATDSKSCASTVAFTLKVTGGIVFNAKPLPNGVTNTTYPTQTILQATGGTGPLTYEAIGLPPGLSFNEATLQITGTPTQKGTFNIPITVTDANGNKVVANYSIKVTDPLILPTATLADGITNNPYTVQVIPTATGGTGPYTYNASGLPNGLVFNELTREITGTPTTVGTTTFPITVTDADLNTVTTNYTIKVTAPLVLPNASLPDGIVNAVYTPITLPQATGGSGSYTYTATGVPPGLILDLITRQLTGTPTQAGNYSISVTVKDSENRTASNIYTIKIIGVLSLPSAVLPNGTVGTLYPTIVLPGVSGGTSPYTYVATGLPPGLNFNTTTREITGTPTVGGTYTITVTAKDSGGQTVSADYIIVVNVNAPIVNNAIICSGNSVTLSVNNLQNGVTYNWYAATGSTALVQNNAGVYITGALNSSTTFYVEAVSGTAVSTRTAVSVTVNPPATAPTVLTNSQNINAGQTTTLTATADAGDVIRWYNVSTGGSVLGTGNNFTTPVLNTTTTYYVEAVNANNCASSPRVAVVVTVNISTTSPACNAANNQTSGINGLCILCGIVGAGNSTDANLANFTTIRLTAGVIAVGYQQLIFPSNGVATDSVKINLGLPGGLADLTVLSSVTVNVMSGPTVVKTYQLNPALIHLTLLGGNRFSVTLPATAGFDRVEIRFGGVASLISSLDIYGAEIIYPKPTLVSNSITICSGQTATINATANGGTTLSYYSASTGGTLLGTGASYTTTNLTATTVYYIQISKAGCANTDRVPVTINVTPILSVPVLATVADICAGGTTTLSVVNPDPTINYNWYTVSFEGSKVFTGSTFVTPILNSTTSYYVEAALGNCTSGTRAEANVLVNPRPILPTLTASATTINSGQTAILTATSTQNGVTFRWFSSANATTPEYIGDTYVTPPLNATTTYYVETQSASGCISSSRVQITVTVNPGGGPIGIPCEIPISQTNGINGITLFANVFNPDLAIDNDVQTASTLVMPIGILNGYAYQNVVFPSVSKVGDTVKMLISSPGKLLSLALLGNLSVTTYTDGNSNNDPLFLNNSLLNVQLLSGNTQALISFVPTSTYNGVELRLNSGALSALTSINLNYVQSVVATPKVIVTGGSSCAGQTATLQVESPSGNYTYRWYDSSGNYLAGKDGSTFVSPILTANTVFFVDALSANGCSSPKTTVNISIVDVPSVPVLVANNVSACAGNTVTLEIKNPVDGYTYRWYENNNYLAGKDSTSYIITTLATDASYSVEAVNSCSATSLTRATATVTVGTLGVPVISPVAVTISSGSPVTLTASSSTAGAIINWYSDLSPNVSLHTGAVYTTEPISSTTVFYAEATSSSGCPASGRASVTVTVESTGPNDPAPCGYATKLEREFVSPGALLAGVFNKDFAVDGLVNTGSTLFIPVGIVGGSVSQRIGFTGGLSNVGDTLRLRISSPAKLLSLSVLSSLRITTYSGSVSNIDSISVNGPLVVINLLSDGSSAVLTIVPTKQFDGVQLTLNSGLASILSSVNFNYAQRIVQKPIVTASSVSTCQGMPTELSVSNPQPNITYKWYLGNIYQTGKDGATFTTDAGLIPGSYEYYVTASANNCETAGTKVTVVVLAQPDIPVVTSNNPTVICINTSATLSVQAVAGVTFNWYDSSTGGNVLVSNNNSYTTPSNLTAGTYDFYVQAVNGNNCNNSTRTKITLIINPSAVASEIQVTGTTTLCASVPTTLTAAAPLVVNPKFTWYKDAALTDVVSSLPTYQPAVSVTTTFYVTVSGDNRCANALGNAKEVTITVNPIAVAADINLSGSSSVCAGAKVSLTASSTTVQSPVFSWYSNATLLNKLYEGENFEVSAVTGSATYYVTVKGANKCENSPATAKSITVTVNPLATASDIVINGNTTVCKNTGTTLSATSSTVVNPVFTWYSNIATKTVVYTGATFPTPSLALNTTYYVTVKGDNKCENADVDAKAVTITVNDYATAADITVNNAQICSGSAVTLMASSSTVTSPVFTWYNDASLTSVAFSGPNYTITNLTVDKTYYVTVKGTNKCENSIADAKIVKVTVNPLATSTDIIISGTTTICKNTAVILTASSTISNAVYTWYTDVNLTNVAHIGATYSPTLSNTTSFYVTVKGDNKCENSSGNARVVTVTVNPYATAADISVAGTTTICKNTGTTLTASSSTVTNAVFTWYSNIATKTVAYVGATFETPSLAQSTTYYVTVKGDNKCENADADAKAVTVTVKEYATAADISVNNAQICSGSDVTLRASSLSVNQAVFTWYNDASLTSVAFSGPNFTVTNLTIDKTFYVTVKGTDKCENTAADAKAVTVTVNPLATSADILISGNTTTCANTAVTLTASSTVVNPTYTWYSESTLNNVVHNGASYSPSLSSTTSFYVTVKGDNKCENSSGNARMVTVTVNPRPSNPIVSTTGTSVCSGNTTVLTVQSPEVGVIYNWYKTSTGGILAGTGTSFTTDVITASTVYYAEAVLGSCISPSRTMVTVSPLVVPLAPASVTADPNPVCPGGSTTITVNNPDGNLVYRWYLASSGGASLAEGTRYNPTNLNATTIYYVESVAKTGGCVSLSRTAVTVSVNQLAVESDVVITGNTTTCANVAVTLTASSTVNNAVYTWYSTAALNNVVNVGTTYSPTLTSTTSFYVTVKGSNRCENAVGTARVVQVIVNAQPTNPIISSTGTNICAGAATSLSIQNAQPGVVYDWYNAPTAGNILLTGTIVNTPILNTSIDYYVQATGTGACLNPGGRIKVTVTVNPIPINPTVAVTSVSACLGSPALLAISNPQNGITYNWYTLANGGTIIGTGSTFSTPAVSASVTYYVEAVSGSCTSLARAMVSVVPLTVPVAPASVSVGNNPLCSGSSTMLTINNPDQNFIYKWYATSTGGSALAEGNTFNTPNLTATTIFYVESNAKNGGCVSLGRTAVTVNVLPIMATPVVRVESTTISSVTFSWNAVAGATAYEVSGNNGISWQNASLGTSYTVNGLQPSEAVTIMVRAYGQIGCQTSANSTPLTAIAKNPLANEVYIPNAFTPNNDGKNDVFLIFGTTINSMKMNVYTQWGQLLFQSEFKNFGWDGTFKGVAQPAGVYAYMIEIESNDGTKTIRKGTITLIR